MSIREKMWFGLSVSTEYCSHRVAYALISKIPIMSDYTPCCQRDRFGNARSRMTADIRNLDLRIEGVQKWFSEIPLDHQYMTQMV